MNTFLKAMCIVIYATAVIVAFGVFHAGFTSIVQEVAVIFLALHVVELLVAFRSVQRHPGPLVDSIGLTLLFGFLHWRPLAKRA